MLKINVSPISSVRISSKSKFSTHIDECDIVQPLYHKDFTFHTKREKSPWIKIDLNNIYNIDTIRVFNRLKSCQDKAKTLTVEISTDDINFEIIKKCNENWGDHLIIDLNDREVRYLKFSLQEEQFFHLYKIDIFVKIHYLFDTSDKRYHLLKLIDNFQESISDNILLNITDVKENSIAFYCDTVKKFFRYQICNTNSEYFIELIYKNEKYKNIEVYNFFKSYANKYRGSILFRDKYKEISLISKIKLNNLLNFLRSFFHDTNKIFWGFFNITNYQLLNKYNKIKNKEESEFIIDSDLVKETGFADRMRGILSCCYLMNQNNIRYKIKFCHPFDLTKYYRFNNSIIDYNNVDENEYNFYILKFKTKQQILENDLKNLLLHSRQGYDKIFIGTNVSYYKNYNGFFNSLFEPKDILNDKINYYKDLLRNKYISISFRVMNLFGDFDEENPYIKCNNVESRKLLINNFKDKLYNFIKNISSDVNILVFSDSKFLVDSLSEVDRVLSIPGNIGHIGKLNKNNKEAEELFFKTLLDFHMIMFAEKIYRANGKYFYLSGFPELAAQCSGKPFLSIDF